MRLFLFYFASMFVVGLFFGAILLHLRGHRKANAGLVGRAIKIAVLTAIPVAAISTRYPVALAIWTFESIGLACLVHAWVRPDYKGRTLASSIWSVVVLIPLLGPAIYLVASGSPDAEWHERRIRQSKEISHDD